ncbi:hypothetical protein GCM10007275_12260 [Jeotgalicoccus coquinae]|uniref:Uncharacterized protein n=1 Tax=Jeotgalicoccus coquinae TaxID=709509 RepID=A0A6V7RPV8_9STAP|nr:hypothetical protein [Jeotgalicoccus coquinae]MBB6422108.1 hypothetical protein [Jeotgalicoccus coquinae]GGE18585.1 hypothetical protein GCM10007275_12260 [Jeotgalicoccus coquinae]CAD2079718.1 hypothetical protein JEOCOQ751_01547 [Jeotgalicoccus coquinae]
MFLKSEEDDRRPDRKKYHFDPTKVLIGTAVGFIIPEIARFLSENVIGNNTLENIAGVSSIGLAIIFGIIMLFVTFKVEMIYNDETSDSDDGQKIRGEQNEITDMLSEYHAAKEAGDTGKMKEIAVWLKEHGVIIKK